MDINKTMIKLPIVIVDERSEENNTDDFEENEFVFFEDMGEKLANEDQDIRYIHFLTTNNLKKSDQLMHNIFQIMKKENYDVLIRPNISVHNCCYDYELEKGYRNSLWCRKTLLTELDETFDNGRLFSLAEEKELKVGICMSETYARNYENRLRRITEVVEAQRYLLERKLH